jgi:hypothetical protein
VDLLISIEREIILAAIELSGVIQASEGRRSVHIVEMATIRPKSFSST